MLPALIWLIARGFTRLPLVTGVRASREYWEYDQSAGETGDGLESRSSRFGRWSSCEVANAEESVRPIAREGRRGRRRRADAIV